MPTQYQIEKRAGIDKHVARFINQNINTLEVANHAATLVLMQCAQYDEQRQVLLKKYIDEIKREIVRDRSK